MKRSGIALLCVLAFGAAVLGAQTPQRGAARGAAAPAKPLEIYIVDTEGGKAALWVTPSGQSLLIDAGNPGGRDTDRIMEVLAAAGVTKLDFLLLSHYHVDHVGGVAELVKRLPPIAHFLDHGATAEDGVDGHQREQVAGFQAAYAEMYGKAQHTILKPGDKIPITGLDWRIVTSAAQVIKTPLPGGGKPNPECATAQRQPEARDPDNGYSVGSVIGFGASFRALDFGDMTRDIEFDLVCPNNPIGTIDLFFPANHGSNNSNAPFFVHAIQPRVAVVQNGSGKGASVDMFQALRSTPGFQDVWQLHWANGAGVEHNSPGVFIANGVDPTAIATALTAPPRGGGGGGGRPGGPGGAPGGVPPGAPAAAGAPGGVVGGVAGGVPAGAPPPPGPPPVAPAAAGAPTGGANPPAGAPGGQAAPGGGGRGGGGAAAHTPAYWIKISVEPSGTFTVTNSRNNFSKTYTKR